MVLQPRVLVRRAAVVQAAPPHHVLPHVAQLLHSHRLQQVQPTNTRGASQVRCERGAATCHHSGRHAAPTAQCDAPARRATRPTQWRPAAVLPWPPVRRTPMRKAAPAVLLGGFSHGAVAAALALIRKSTAPCVTPRSTTLVSPLDDITAPRRVRAAGGRQSAAAARSLQARQPS